MQNKSRVSIIIQKSWLRALLIFCFVQVVFIFMDVTGWIPNLKDFDGKLIGNVMNSFIFKEWFHFYNTPFFNLVTVLLGVTLLCEISFTFIRSLLKKAS